MLLVPLFGKYQGATDSVGPHVVLELLFPTFVVLEDAWETFKKNITSFLYSSRGASK